jgi:hypothetical protein
MCFLSCRQLLVRVVIPRSNNRDSDDEGELTDPLPHKLRSSVVRNVEHDEVCTILLACAQSYKYNYTAVNLWPDT